MPLKTTVGLCKKIGVTTATHQLWFSSLQVTVRREVAFPSALNVSARRGCGMEADCPCRRWTTMFLCPNRVLL